MKSIIFFFSFILSLMARDNPFLPFSPNYTNDKNTTKSVTVEKNGEKTIKKRITFHQDIKKIKRITIEYERKDGTTSTQSVILNLDSLNSYIDLYQSDKVVLKNDINREFKYKETKETERDNIHPFKQKN